MSLATWAEKPASRTKPESIVKPYVLSHGTCECYDLHESRTFYEEYLGLECVQIAKDGLIFSLGLKFHVVCLQMGARLRPLSMLNHWGLEVRSPEEVQSAHAAAHQMKDKYKIGSIMPMEMVGGRYSFYLVTALAPCVAQLNFDRTGCRPWGVRGGKDGAAPITTVERSDAPPERKFKGTVQMRAGDRLRVLSSGGGGYGDPQLRDPKKVVRDRRNGYVSREGTHRDYGLTSDETNANDP